MEFLKGLKSEGDGGRYKSKPRQGDARLLRIWSCIACPRFTLKLRPYLFSSELSESISSGAVAADWILEMSLIGEKDVQ